MPSTKVLSVFERIRGNTQDNNETLLFIQPEIYFYVFVSFLTALVWTKF